MAFLNGVILVASILLAVGSFFYWRKKAQGIERKDKNILQDFVSLLVHDLRGPLDNIQKMSELMLSSATMSEDRRHEYTGLIHDSASSMLVLINNISDAAKLGAGNLVVKKMEGNIIQFVKDRVSFFSLSVKNAGLTISASFGENIPGSLSFDSRIVSDTVNILLSNAIKFNQPRGSITVDVFRHTQGDSLAREAKENKIIWFPPVYHESKKADTDSVVIAITHNDIGIPEKTLPLLFTKYDDMGETFLEKIKQAHGISLFIAKHLVLHAGGSIGAGSKEGTGTTFYFTVPLS